MVKFGVILGGIAIIIIAILLFGGKKESSVISQVSGKSDVSEAPGSSNISETYRQNIEEENTRRIEEAIRQDESVLPMPVEPAKGTVGIQFEEPEEEDPLERWRRMNEERVRQEQIQQQKQPDAPIEPEVDTRTPAINAMASAMSQQMESILENQNIKSPQIMGISTMSYLEAIERKQQEEIEAARQEQLTQQSNLAIAEQEEAEVLLPAGTIEYAQLLIEANTDAPGPVLASMQSGPLRGSRLIGSFTATENYLTLNFNQIVINGISYGITAIAIDPETTLPGVVTDINRRYLRRIVMPMAAEFITGLTDAIASSGQTTITISGDSVSETTSSSTLDNDQEVASGITAAGDELSTILDEISDVAEPMLKIRAGTPIGVLFTSAVTDTQLGLDNDTDNGSTAGQITNTISNFTSQ